MHRTNAVSTERHSLEYTYICNKSRTRIPHTWNTDNNVHCTTRHCFSLFLSLSLFIYIVYELKLKRSRQQQNTKPHCTSSFPDSSQRKRVFWPKCICSILNVCKTYGSLCRELCDNNNNYIYFNLNDTGQCIASAWTSTTRSCSVFACVGVNSDGHRSTFKCLPLMKCRLHIFAYINIFIHKFIQMILAISSYNNDIIVVIDAYVTDFYFIFNRWLSQFIYMCVCMSTRVF